MGVPLNIPGGVLRGLPFFFDPLDAAGGGLAEKASALAVPLTLPFTSTVTELDLTQTYLDMGLFGLQTLFIDNSASSGATTILLKGGGPLQAIVAKPFSQGYYRVMASPQTCDLAAFNFASAIVQIELINADLSPYTWDTQAPALAQGTPAAASSGNVANASAVATIPAIAGRTLYITGFTITGGGATAGQTVNATLAGVANGSGTTTLTYTFSSPTGPTIAAQPLVQSFSPALQIAAGQAAVLTLPALGAGNTNASVTLQGFYV